MRTGILRGIIAGSVLAAAMGMLMPRRKRSRDGLLNITRRDKRQMRSRADRMMKGVNRTMKGWMK